jgi:hypothetical protein
VLQIFGSTSTPDKAFYANQTSYNLIDTFSRLLNKRFVFSFVEQNTAGQEKAWSPTHPSPTDYNTKAKTGKSR